jgi:hypothetical protein
MNDSILRLLNLVGFILLLMSVGYVLNIVRLQLKMFKDFHKRLIALEHDHRQLRVQLGVPSHDEKQESEVPSAS